ncbi:MAG: hypothetical protein GY788_07495 [bacterium]|nr:hypothetical protein [bacterium]
MAEKKVNIILSTIRKGTGIKQISRELGKLKKQVVSFAKSAGIGLGVFSGTASAAAIASIKNHVDEIDRLGKSADALGIKAEELSKLAFAAELSGSSLQGVTDALEKMLNRISKAADGTGEVKDALAELGLQAAELETLSPDQQFKLLADAISAVQTQADKVRLKRAIFGRGDSNIINLLNQTSVGINEVGENLERLNGVVTDADTRAAAEFADSMATLGATLSAFGRTAVSPVVDKLNEVFETLGIDAAPRVEKIDRAIAALQGRIEVFQRIRAGEGETTLEKLLGIRSSDEELGRLIGIVQRRLGELEKEKEKYAAKDAELEQRQASLRAAAEHNKKMSAIRKAEQAQLKAALQAKEDLFLRHEEALQQSRDRQKAFAEEIKEAIDGIENFGQERPDPDQFDIVDKTAAAWNSINAGDTAGARAAITALIEMFRQYQEAGKASAADVVSMTGDLEALARATERVSDKGLEERAVRAAAAAQDLKDEIEGKPINATVQAAEGSGKAVINGVQQQVDRELQADPVTVQVVLGIQAGGNLPGVMTQGDYNTNGPGADVQHESDKRGIRI